MKQKTENPPPASITFAQNIMFRDEAENRSVFLEAGAPSPWNRISDVPSALQGLIGTPDFSTPASTENQHWTSPQLLAAERAAFQQLVGDEDMDPAIRAELAARDAEHLALSQSRNKTLDEIEGRRDEAYDRVAKEIAEEADRLIERKHKNDPKTA